MFRKAMLLVSMCSAAHAHFLWLAPGANKQESVRLHFSETPAAGEPELLDRVAGAEVTVIAADASATKPKAVKGTDGWIFPGAPAAQANTSFVYGVLSRGGSAPFLLRYHARAVFSRSDADACAALKLDLTMRRAADGTLTLTVLFDGKPLAGAKFTAACADGKPAEGTSDKDGKFTFRPEGKGPVGIRAAHVEAVSGELGGKKYESVRHHVTLTISEPTR